MIKTKRTHSGFTLLELLLVIFLLGVLAMTSFAVVQDGDDQQRYDATKTYYQLIKKAIIGDATLMLNGEADVSGFVADMGRLPNCLRELLEITGCDASNATDDLPAWAQDAETQVWSGWHGPYLQGIPESVGLTFRDGWKNEGAETDSGANNPDARNYGWLFGVGAADSTSCQLANVAQLVPNSLYLQSCGSNAAVDNVSTGNYSDDYPFLSTTSYQPLVVEADHQVVLGSAWDHLMVEIVNDAGLPLNISADSLRLSINYPVNGVLPICAASGANVCNPAEEFAPFLSDTFPEFGWNAATKVVSLSESTEAALPAGTVAVTPRSFSIVQDGALVMGDGSKIYFVGCSAPPFCEVTTNVDITLDGNSRFAAPAGGVNMTLPASNVGSIQFAVSGLLKPYIDVPEGSVPGGAQTVILPDATTLTFNNNVAFMQGSDSRVIVDAATYPFTVTASSSLSMVGNRVAVNGVADVFLVPPGSSLDSATQLTLTDGLAVPAGQRSITVVCDASNNSAGTYRELYDGDCDGAAGDGTPVPVLLKVKPRTTLTPPVPIRWQIR